MIRLIQYSLFGALLSFNSYAADSKAVEPTMVCQTPGKEDSYKLAVSWQPAFCESQRNVPECSITDNNSYQATNFTLHGLWPNKRECKADYGMCGKYKQPAKSFCSYDPVPIKTDTLKKVGEVMPSIQKNSCLERHEWYKHGTCQIDWDADGYFLAAVRLTKEFNDSGISAFMKRNLGKSVATEEFLKTVDNAFGKGARNRLMLGCDMQGNLVDVFINLPPQIPDNLRLADLIRQAPESFGNRCGNTFMVDMLGYRK